MTASKISIVMMFPDRRKGHGKTGRQMAGSQEALGFQLCFWLSRLETFKRFLERTSRLGQFLLHDQFWVRTQIFHSSQRSSALCPSCWLPVCPATPLLNNQPASCFALGGLAPGQLKLNNTFPRLSLLCPRWGPHCHLISDPFSSLL